MTERMTREQFVTAKPGDVNSLTGSKLLFRVAPRIRKWSWEGLTADIRVGNSKDLALGVLNDTCTGVRFSSSVKSTLFTSFLRDAVFGVRMIW